MFNTKMGERRVVEFIKEVEKHPCIYNVTMPEYSNRTETKRAWSKIAETMECTENECKEKWRKLRIAFMRSLKHMKATNQNKPYYLYDYLAFLLPYIKIGDQQTYDHEETVTNFSPSNSDDEEPMPSRNNNTFEEESEDDKNDTNRQIIFVNDRLSERPRNEQYAQDRQKQNDNRKRKNMEDIENNPRKMFLLSLIPEVESFSEEEMRVFRRTVVSCIDNIIDSRKKYSGRF